MITNGGTRTQRSGAGVVARAIALVKCVPGRLEELVPPPAERCGRSPARGAPRVLLAAARQVRGAASRAVVALDDDPAASVIVDLRTPHGRRLFGYGFCEPAARVMRSLLRPGDVMIDGGANIGLYTVLAASKVGPRGEVIACEPSPATMSLLRENVRHNNFGWVDLHEVAIAAAPGRLSLQVFAPGSGYSSFAPADAAGSTSVEVEVTTLDDLAGDRLERTRLVKLDTEGAELLALQGATRLLERARPDFIVELEPDHLARQASSIAEVQALFEDAGYVGYAIDRGSLAPLRGAWTRPLGDPNVVVRPREQ